MMRFIAGLTVAVAIVGCAEPSAEQVPFNLTGAPTVEFSVPDMMCPEGCGVEVKEILAKQPGARDVLIDFEHKTAIVAVEQARFDADAAIAALADQMFPNSKLKGAEVSVPQAESASVQ